MTIIRERYAQPRWNIFQAYREFIQNKKRRCSNYKGKQIPSIREIYDNPIWKIGQAYIKYIPGKKGKYGQPTR